MNNGDTFKFSDYDCIGFDLDNTLARYKTNAMVEMQYDFLAQYLLKKGYMEKHLLKPIDFDFLSRGLIIDAERGNIIKISHNGQILTAYHGTHLMDTPEIEKYYSNGKWEILNMFVKDPFDIWDGPNSLKLRSIIDCFDIVISLIFARGIDSKDEQMKGTQVFYNVYMDILLALQDMFNVAHFQSREYGYYHQMKQNPSLYYHKCSENIKNWLKNLKKQGKIIYLITGSHVDFASHTASYTLGSNWREFFDIVITYAKKPGFFSQKREFLNSSGLNKPIAPNELKKGSLYSQGNWSDLYQFLTKHSANKHPKCLFIGDGILQDVCAPNIYSECDTVAVCEELMMEKDNNSEGYDRNSPIWGSLFQHGNIETFWHKLIKENAKLCIPDLESVARLPLEHEFIPVF